MAFEGCCFLCHASAVQLDRTLRNRLLETGLFRRSGRTGMCTSPPIRDTRDVRFGDTLARLMPGITPPLTLSLSMVGRGLPVLNTRCPKSSPGVGSCSITLNATSIAVRCVNGSDADGLCVSSVRLYPGALVFHPLRHYSEPVVRLLLTVVGQR